ncbi:hypothetical protein MNBD_GAMMA05-447 [hydrothermal vent metagenome]|uniref:DUF4412 domain-containing protein n=1 Tax=hydrothermal vent metagenome TaxID=652676 RepID=A0A3B0WTU1_9ZZZZ
MIKKIILPCLLSALSFSVFAAEKENVFKLTYIEREQGMDEYEVTMLVSDRYIRVDESGEESGFIIYDDKDKTIFSVSHHDHSILVIKEHVFSNDSSPVKPVVEYLELADAPMVSGKSMFNYRVFVNVEKKGVEETCMEIQLVEGLMPEVRKILQNYQKVVSGQQVKMVDNEITEMQTACFFVDQIYNSGEYYEKGLPVQEWHSNEGSKILTDYKKVSVNSNKFKLPEDYRQFSIGADSKTFIN